MKVLIIEDENLTAKRLESMLHKIDSNIEVMDILASVEKTVAWLERHPAPEIIFMDIHLEDDLAFKIFEEINVESPIIFTTAFDEYMIRAFKVNSIDYLLKPINQEDLTHALDKLKLFKKQFSQSSVSSLLDFLGHRTAQYKSRILITVGTKLKTIEVDDIAYFYSEEKITFLRTKSGQHFPVDYSLDKLIQLLNPELFFRINRQMIISIKSVITIHTHFKGRLKLELKPEASQEIFVSGDRMADFKEWLGK
jgi:DNA-binding LytR/AlgR family response regulator